jgi:MATE family multidrug resistance protein
VIGHRLAGAAAFSRRYDREIASLAVPALGALAADPLVSLIDTAFVGRLGAEELAALGVASAVFAVAFFLFNFVAYATTPLVAQAVGAGDRAAAGRYIVTALVIAVVGGVATLAVLELLAEPILRLMGADDDTLEPALTYLRIRALATPAVLLILAGHGALILIFGLGLGIAGAAWATVTAQWLGAAGFLWLLLVARRTRFGIRRGWPAMEVARRFGGASRDLVVRTAVLLVTLTLATAVAARVGTEEVAAHQVALQLWVFLALATDALAVAAQAMVGKYLGEDAATTARGVADRMLVLGAGVGVVFAAGMALLAPILTGAFSDDAEVVALLRSVYWFVVLLQPLGALVFVWDGIVMGAADFGYLARAMLVAGGAAVAVLLAVLPMGWGIAGVWWGITVLMVGRAATLSWWYWRRATVLTAQPAGH